MSRKPWGSIVMSDYGSFFHICAEVPVLKHPLVARGAQYSYLEMHNRIRHNYGDAIRCSWRFAIGFGNKCQLRHGNLITRIGPLVEVPTKIKLFYKVINWFYNYINWVIVSKASLLQSISVGDAPTDRSRSVYRRWSRFPVARRSPLSTRIMSYWNWTNTEWFF